MLRDLEEIDEPDKPRLPRKLRGDLRQGYLENLRHDDLARRKRVMATELHVRSLPQANGGCDLTAANAIAESSDELHVYGRRRGWAAVESTRY